MHDEPEVSNATIHVMFFLRLIDLGGAELTMLSIARGLKLRGFKVTFALYGSRTDLAKSRLPGIDILNMNASRTLSAIVPFYRTLRSQRPDVVISALTHTNLIAVVVSAFTRIRIKIITSDHNPIFTAIENNPDWKHYFLKYLVGALYPFASRIVTVSQGIADELGRMLPVSRRIEVIYNPVIGSAEPAVGIQPHPWLTSSDDNPLVIGIGRLGDEKDFTTLVRAFAIVCSKRKSRLVILGEGAQRTTLTDLAKELGIESSFLLPGFVDNVSEWLQSSAVFVCSSKFEGFGNAIVEAMYCGIAVVSTDCPVGPSEILEAGRFGRLVPVSDPAAMAVAIEEALDRPGDLEAAKLRAGQFTETRCSDSYAALVRSLCVK